MIQSLRSGSAAVYRRLHHVERWLWRDRVPVLGIVMFFVIVAGVWEKEWPAATCLSLIFPLFSWIAARSKDAAERQAQSDERAKELGSITQGQAPGPFAFGGAPEPWYEPALRKGQKTLEDLFGGEKK